MYLSGKYAEVQRGCVSSAVPGEAPYSVAVASSGKEN